MTGFRAALGGLEITRPHNCAIGFACVLVGAYLSEAPWDVRIALWAAASAALVQAAGNALNDIADLALDAVAKPHRPLPRGALSRRAAIWEAAVLGGFGVAIGVALGPATAAIALGAACLLVGYDLWLKSTALWGNVAVSVASGATFVYGGVALGDARVAFAAGALAALFHLAREIVKDAADADADRAFGARTLAVLWGPARATRLASGLVGLLAVLALLPYALGLFRAPYLWVTVGVVDPILIAAAIALPRADPGQLEKWATVLKVDTVAALGAMFLGASVGRA